MSIKPLMDLGPDDIVRCLLYQQFYYGHDKIYGRTKDLFEYIPGSGEIIDKFYDLISSKIDLVDKKKYLDYLKFFNEQIHEIEIDEIYSKFQMNLEELGDEMNRTIIMSMIVGQALLHVHQACFHKAIGELFQNLPKIKNKPSFINESNEHEIVQNGLFKLYSLGIPQIGILHSLSFLRFIAIKTNNNAILTQINPMIKKYFEKIINEIYNRISKISKF